MSRLIPFLAVLVCLAVAGEVAACGRCGYAKCRYASSYIAPSYTYPYYDQRFQAIFNIALPAPTATGSTVYQSAPFDYNEAVRLQANLSARTLELSQDHSRVIATLSQQATDYQSQQVRSQNLATIERIVNGVPSESSLTLSLRRDASGKIIAEPRAEARAEHGGIAALATSKCVKCHGATKAEKALRLDTFTVGGKPIDDRYWDDVVLKRIIPDDPAEQMPPPASGLKLTFLDKMLFVDSPPVAAKPQLKKE